MLHKVIEITEKYENKKNILEKADIAFILAYEEFLKTLTIDEEHLTLKNIEKYDVIIEAEQDIKIENCVDSEPLFEETTEKIEKYIKQKRQKKINNNPDIKNLYRNIVKKVHPDKNIDDNLEYRQYYLDATQAYENKLLFPLVKIAAKLKIDTQLSMESLQIIEEELDKLIEEIQMMEFSFCWTWFHAPNKDLQHQMLLMYHQRKEKKY